MQCPICEKAELTGDGIKMEACFTCARTLGIVPMPPVSRPPKPCATCGGRKFLRAIPREHSAGHVGGDVNTQVSVPMMLTHKPPKLPTLYDARTGTTKVALDITRGWGWLEVYACYGCGNVEWYCSNVAEVPIRPNLMTDVVEYDEGGPYR